MCLPILAPLGAALGAGAGSAAAVGTLTAAQTVLGAYSAFQQTSSARSQAKYQAQVDANNATLAGYDAAEADRIGFDAAQKRFRENAAFKSKQIATAAASGLDVSQGSTADIIDATDYFGRIDAETIRGNARKQAWGSTMEQRNYQSSSAANRAASKAYNPNLSVGISLLSGAGNIADKWVRNKIA